MQSHKQTNFERREIMEEKRRKEGRHVVCKKVQTNTFPRREGGTGSVSSHLTTSSRAGQTHQPLADLTHTLLEDGQTSASETQTRGGGGEGEAGGRGPQSY